MRRFERIHDVVESVEEYRRGGYHPVHLHDLLNQRYDVIGKLAFGQFSTVWLAHDQMLQRQVALKILKADASKDNKDLAMLLRLSAPGLDHPGKAHVIELLDHFEHNGPNGTHLCLVLPVMASDGQAMCANGRPHPVAYTRSIAKQILLGLDFLHSLDIIHCDLQPANIMFSIVGDTHGELSLEPPEFSPVRWLEGTTIDDSAPKYLMPTQRRRAQLDDVDHSQLLVRIGDLGGAVRNRERDQLPVTPRALRAPELIQRNTWDAKIDIWTFGCLVFELATNEPLFPLGCFFSTAEESDKELLSLISQLLGKDIHMHETFLRHLMARLPPDFAAENLQDLASFLWSTLQGDPQRRMTTSELLKQPFLAQDEIS